jgi:hypothetical protein
LLLSGRAESGRGLGRDEREWHRHAEMNMDLRVAGRGMPVDEEEQTRRVECEGGGRKNVRRD